MTETCKMQRLTKIVVTSSSEITACIRSALRCNRRSNRLLLSHERCDETEIEDMRNQFRRDGEAIA